MSRLIFRDKLRDFDDVTPTFSDFSNVTVYFRDQFEGKYVTLIFCDFSNVTVYFRDKYMVVSLINLSHLFFVTF